METNIFGESDNDFWGEAEDNRTSIAEKIVEDKAIKLKIAERDKAFRKIRTLHDLCPIPKPGEQWRIITEKQFNAFALIQGAVENDIIEELYLAVYRINEPIVANLIDLIESGKIRRATFVISSFFNQTKKPEQWAKRLREYCANNPNTSHIYCHNHSKVVAFKTQGGGYFVFEGSGNMSDNARIEQYLYEQSEASYNFHKSWMLELVDKYGKKES